MDDIEFKIGDIVDLKSGGPNMTVEGVEKDNVECIWFHKFKANTRSTKLTSAELKRVSLTQP